MKRLLFILIGLGGFFGSQAQFNVRESVFTHLSSEELLVGETLYFQNYVFSQQTSQLSDLSRIVYIEILDSKNKPVYQTKVLLDHGKGGGKYFVPTDLKTGKYQFIAYTRWMKNFDAFFHQSISIINPYQNQSFENSYVSQMTLDVKVEGDDLVAGIPNKIVIRVKDQFGIGMKTKGKVIAESGGTPSEFQTDDYGFAAFELIPEKTENYQLVIENDSKFEFYDLPKSCDDCYALKINHFDNYYQLNFEPNNKNLNEEIDISIYDNQQPIFKTTSRIGSNISISKNEIPEGLLRIVCRDKKEKIVERLILNKAVDISPINPTQYIKVGSNASLTFNIPDLASLSISVEQSDEHYSGSLYWYSLIDSKINHNLPLSFYQKATYEKLDHLLIASEFIGGKSNPLEVKFLPEVRSGLVQGKVTDDKGQSIPHIAVGIAYSGARPQMSATMTDSAGQFVISYDPLFSAGIPMLDLLNEELTAKISVEPEFYESYPEIIEMPIYFDSLKVARIIQRSIYNQIMNAYETEIIGQDTVNSKPQFFDVKTYHLDQYKRFSTMRDTFIELIAEVGVSKIESNYSFKMRSKDLPTGIFTEYPTLLLLDGAFVSSKDLMELSPYLVDKIEIVDRRYYFGEIIFDGVISVSTRLNDRGEIEPKGVPLKLTKIQSKSKEFIINEKVRIPNYEDLIYWNPNLIHAGGDLDVHFKTSNVTGWFEVRIEGITKEGKPISRQAYFKVEP